MWEILFCVLFRCVFACLLPAWPVCTFWSSLGFWDLLGFVPLPLSTSCIDRCLPAFALVVCLVLRFLLLLVPAYTFVGCLVRAAPRTSSVAWFCPLPSYTLLLLGSCSFLQILVVLLGLVVWFAVSCLSASFLHFAVRLLSSFLLALVFVARFRRLPCLYFVAWLVCRCLFSWLVCPFFPLACL